MAAVSLLGATPASAAGGMAISSGRLGAIVAAVVGLISVVLGGRALTRPAGPRGAMAALVLGLTGTVLSGLHLARFSGPIGTGSGRLGAIVALVLGLIGVVLACAWAIRNLRRSSPY